MVGRPDGMKLEHKSKVEQMKMKIFQSNKYLGWFGLELENVLAIMMPNNCTNMLAF